MQAPWTRPPGQLGFKPRATRLQVREAPALVADVAVCARAVHEWSRAITNRGAASHLAGTPVARSSADATMMTEHVPGGLTLLLCGAVMLGRGIDQILAAPCDPRLYESYVKDAREYVGLAEEHSGEIPRKVAPAYPWGDALEILD